MNKKRDSFLPDELTESIVSEYNLFSYSPNFWHHIWVSRPTSKYKICHYFYQQHFAFCIYITILNYRHFYPGRSTFTIHFYARQLYRQVQLRARISHGNSAVRLSVRPSVTTRYGFKAMWDRDSGSSPYDSLEVRFLWGNYLVPLGKEIPLERGHQRGVPP